MTRKILVVLIAIIYIIMGASNLFYALFTGFSPQGIWLLDPFRLVGGALGLYAGLTMLRLNEFGRKLVMILLSLRVGMNVWMIWQLFSLENGAGFGIRNRLGEIVYKINAPYAYHGFLFIWIVFALLTIIFLSQKETKNLFAPETITNQ